MSLATPRSVSPDTRLMTQFMNIARHQAIQLDFDTGLYQQWHPHRSGEIALQRVAGWLGSLRLRDATGTPGEQVSPVLGDGGAVDFARTHEIVRPLAFTGPVVIEFDPPAKSTAYGSMEGRLRESVRHLRDCGWFD